MMNFGGKPPIFLLFFANFWITHPCLWKICRKRDPCLENLGPKNPPIWAAHTRTLNMLCTPPPPGVDDPLSYAKSENPCVPDCQLCRARGRSSACSSWKNNSLLFKNNGQARIFRAYFATTLQRYQSGL